MQQEIVEQTYNSNHKYIRVEVEDKTEITKITIKGTIRIGTDQITGQLAETEDNTDKTEVSLGMSKILEEVILGETLEVMVDKIVGENIEIAIEMIVMMEAEKGLERGHFPEIMAIIELEVQVNVDPDQHPELAQIGIESIIISVGNIIILQGLSNF